MGCTVRLARLVRDGGQVLACIPNVQHYSVIVNLMRGKWDYQDEGLLDRTHLRFFTLSGIRDLFGRAGLQIFDIQPRWWPGNEPERFQQVMTPVLHALAIEPASFAAADASRAVSCASGAHGRAALADADLDAGRLDNCQRGASQGTARVPGHDSGSAHPERDGTSVRGAKANLARRRKDLHPAKSYYSAQTITSTCNVS